MKASDARVIRRECGRAARVAYGKRAGRSTDSGWVAASPAARTGSARRVLQVCEAFL